ncbi:hypothetical protein NUW58_g9218 [Xylaria curta]|uniref:Uncharacterized protein n=1 Tax=Xylaria curta TaxID=42375 RepID=A0ACC1MZU7_9PEZI|nr:hypothetical protein NUW58_g9218 [Xylaria curta]
MSGTAPVLGADADLDLDLFSRPLTFRIPHPAFLCLVGTFVPFRFSSCAGWQPANRVATLQALNQDNSAPTTPNSASRPAPRVPFRQHRAAHSLSSLPATPLLHPRGNHVLLPSVDLPRTEPAQRFGNRVGPQTPTPRKRRKSRESTISAEEESEGNTRTRRLESVAAAAQSYMSQGSHYSQRRGDEDEEVLESQATQAASEMLRRDPRESFDVASSVGSRDVTLLPS